MGGARISKYPFIFERFSAGQFDLPNAFSVIFHSAPDCLSRQASSGRDIGKIGEGFVQISAPLMKREMKGYLFYEI